MILGRVSPKRQPLVPLLLRGTAHQDFLVDALVDTGYTGTLALPQVLIETLQLTPRSARTELVIADGSIVSAESYMCRIVWEGGIERPVRAIAMGDQPVIGMGLLFGYEVCIEAEENGTIRIQLRP